MKNKITGSESTMIDPQIVDLLVETLEARKEFLCKDRSFVTRNDIIVNGELVKGGTRFSVSPLVEGV